ncbi:MAG: sugar phosphate isomerase/epimerase [Clostridia bacterium]|nr:sugar phosphate isomerase/epimerase [Clostridia bacterium]
MSYGISTSCLYPMQTEEALELLGKSGVKTCEVFLNSFSETTPEFAKILNGIKDRYGMKITAVHPFSSFSETFMLFGGYERRYLDAVEFYKRCYEVTAMLGADISIIHGLRHSAPLLDDVYFERFSVLVQEGKKSGVRVAQENVNGHYSARPEFLRKMKMALDRDFSLVFDVKQAVRSGNDPFSFVEEFKNDIIRIHISDNNSESDCLPPGKGQFDFRRLFEIMKSADYKGDYIIELYRDGYGELKELTDSFEYVQSL